MSARTLFFSFVPCRPGVKSSLFPKSGRPRAPPAPWVAAPVQPPAAQFVGIFARFHWTHLRPTAVTICSGSRMGGSVKGLSRGGAAVYKFRETLILLVRNPVRKQLGDSTCFCAIGLGPVGQGWQSVPPGHPENCPNQNTKCMVRSRQTPLNFVRDRPANGSKKASATPELSWGMDSEIVIRAPKEERIRSQNTTAARDGTNMRESLTFAKKSPWRKARGGRNAYAAGSL